MPRVKRTYYANKPYKTTDPEKGGLKIYKVGEIVPDEVIAKAKPSALGRLIMTGHLTPIDAIVPDNITDEQVMKMLEAKEAEEKAKIEGKPIETIKKEINKEVNNENIKPKSIKVKDTIERKNIKFRDRSREKVSPDTDSDV